MGIRKIPQNPLLWVNTLMKDTSQPHRFYFQTHSRNSRVCSVVRTYHVSAFESRQNLFVEAPSFIHSSQKPSTYDSILYLETIWLVDYLQQSFKNRWIAKFNNNYDWTDSSTFGMLTRRTHSVLFNVYAQKNQFHTKNPKSYCLKFLKYGAVIWTENTLHGRNNYPAYFHKRNST